MKAILSFLLLMILVCQTSAQNKRQALSVLWKIESPKTHKISYLLGTLHLFGKEWLSMHPRVDSLLAVSNVYMGELTGSTQDTVKTPTAPLTHVKAKELFGKDYDKVNQYFIKKTGEGLIENIDKDNDPAEILRGMLFYLIQDLAIQKGFKISQEDQLDYELLKKAEKQHKSTVQLDNDKVPRSVDIGSTTTTDKAKQIVNLVNLVSESASVKKVPELTVFELYQKGKHAFNFTTPDKSGEKIAKAITRNNLWMKKIPAYLDKGKVFIAVGADHLNGKDGLITQQKKLGYHLSPVDF